MNCELAPLFHSMAFDVVVVVGESVFMIIITEERIRTSARTTELHTKFQIIFIGVDIERETEKESSCSCIRCLCVCVCVKYNSNSVLWFYRYRLSVSLGSENTITSSLLLTMQ